MKTLIKMIMLGVVMTSGMAIASSEGGTHLDFSSDTESTYTGDVDNDISSNEYVAAQYNCSGAASCGTGGSGGGYNGGGSTTNSAEHYVNTATVVTIPGAQIFHLVEQSSIATHTVGNGIFTAQAVYGDVLAFDADNNPMISAPTTTTTTDENGVEVTTTVAGTQIYVTGITGYTSVEGKEVVAIPGADPIITMKRVAKLDDDGNFTYYEDETDEVQVGKNSLDVQLEIAKLQSDTKVTQTVLSAPPVSAPQINANNADMCRTGISAGGSVVGMGFSAGITLVDKNCEMIKMVRLLNNLGLKDVALSLLGQDSRVAAAMLQANPEYYGRFLSGTTRDLEAESNAAETAANGKVIEHDVIDEDTPSAEGFNLIDLLTKN